MVPLRSYDVCASHRASTKVREFKLVASVHVADGAAELIGCMLYHLAFTGKTMGLKRPELNNARARTLKLNQHADSFRPFHGKFPVRNIASTFLGMCNFLRRRKLNDRRTVMV